MRDIILDTPVLLLLLIGEYDPEYIKIFKRTNKYSKDDFRDVQKIIKKFKRILITPQIITEISNFSFEMHDQSRFEEYMGKLINILSSCKEEYIMATDLFKNSVMFKKVGFTDLSIIELSKKSHCTILTDDFRLNGVANKCGCKSYNFTQIRGYNWFTV